MGLIEVAIPALLACVRHKLPQAQIRPLHIGTCWRETTIRTPFFPTASAFLQQGIRQTEKRNTRFLDPRVHALALVLSQRPHLINVCWAFHLLISHVPLRDDQVPKKQERRSLLDEDSLSEAVAIPTSRWSLGPLEQLIAWLGRPLEGPLARRHGPSPAVQHGAILEKRLRITSQT